MDLQTAKEACKNLGDLRDFLFSRDLFMRLAQAAFEGVCDASWNFDAEPYLKEIHSSDNYSFAVKVHAKMPLYESITGILLQLGYTNTPGGQYAHNEELETYIFNLPGTKQWEGGAFSFSDKNAAYDSFQYMKQNIGKHDFTLTFHIEKEKMADFLRMILSAENLPKELADYISCSSLSQNGEIPLWKNQTLEIINADEEYATCVEFNCPWHEPCGEEIK